jgi:hypothetical protein
MQRLATTNYLEQVFLMTMTTVNNVFTSRCWLPLHRRRWLLPTCTNGPLLLVVNIACVRAIGEWIRDKKLLCMPMVVAEGCLGCLKS